MLGDVFLPEQRQGHAATLQLALIGSPVDRRPQLDAIGRDGEQAPIELAVGDLVG